MQPNKSQPESVTPPHRADAASPLDHTVDQSPAELERAQLLSRQAGPPARVEGYDIQRCLGAGAFGTVWLALQKNTGKQVAIKFYEHRGGLDWSLLNREVEKLAFLYTDRDIVQLIDVGWDATPPFYVMEFLERGSLEQLLRAGPLPAREAVRIVRDVAQALVHAHGRGILHCDLKPANVLLDNDWKVRLADFGQSRLSYEQLPALGTLFYMAPEQADLKATPDARWDVYALGALLFHLLTGSPPHRSADLETRLRDAPSLAARLEQYRTAIVTAARPTAHRSVRGVDKALAEIVDRSLEPDASRRFANAQAVLDALDRRARQRARRPLIALGLVAPVLLLVGTVAQGVIGWRDAVRGSEQSLLDAVQAGNVYAAQGVAGTVQLQLSKLSDAVDRVARSDELRRLLAEPDRELVEDEMQAFLKSNHDYYNAAPNRPTRNGTEPPFASWVVMAPDGMLLARSPLSEVVGRNYAWRDYFQGAMRQADKSPSGAVYVSRVFQSESDQRYRCGISAIVRASDRPDAEILGLLMATIATVSLPFEDARHTAVLVGRWDTNRKPGAEGETSPQPEYLVLRHPKHTPGDVGLEIRHLILERLRQAHENGQPLEPGDATDNNYADPLGDRHAEFRGRWLAGFAPVGNSEFVVVVQRRYDEAVGPVNDLATTLARRGWVALSFGVILLGAMWYYVQRAMNRDDRVESAPSRIQAAIDDEAKTEALSPPPDAGSRRE